MTKDEALRLALEALDSVLANHKGAPVLPWIEAKDAIKAALEVPEEKYTYGTPLLDAMTKDYVPPQRTWVGLTDDAEIFAISNTMPYADRFEFARAIETKLKEKNT